MKSKEEMDQIKIGGFLSALAAIVLLILFIISIVDRDLIMMVVSAVFCAFFTTMFIYCIVALKQKKEG